MLLYDLQADIGETTDVAESHPDVVQRIAAMMEQQHVENPYWPSTTQRPGGECSADLSSADLSSADLSARGAVNAVLTTLVGFHH